MKHIFTAIFLMTSVAALAQSKPAQVASLSLDQLADRYFDEYYFKFNPTAGTAAGFHQYVFQLVVIMVETGRDRGRFPPL